MTVFAEKHKSFGECFYPEHLWVPWVHLFLAWEAQSGNQSAYLGSYCNTKLDIWMYYWGNTRAPTSFTVRHTHIIMKTYLWMYFTFQPLALWEMCSGGLSHLSFTNYIWHNIICHINKNPLPYYYVLVCTFILIWLNSRFHVSYIFCFLSFICCFMSRCKLFIEWKI